uniref:Uncharacterized protein n=1 Tax=Utricularia reniformis TaxID=192314 RepID=A0A1Y0AYY9_9LAMI|nr:hypothetical protein AEK19_MT1316 [Utricularia reniformis]ART30370.1 hypothetical protein AEK19_MT1316 [Utricularia reniformis]
MILNLSFRQHRHSKSFPTIQQQIMLLTDQLTASLRQESILEKPTQWRSIHQTRSKNRRWTVVSRTHTQHFQRWTSQGLTEGNLEPGWPNASVTFKYSNPNFDSLPNGRAKLRFPFFPCIGLS